MPTPTEQATQQDSDESFYVYRMRDTGESSSKFGPCEGCGEHCSEVFLQVELRTYRDFNGHEKLTRHECTTAFGHQDCIACLQRISVFDDTQE